MNGYVYSSGPFPRNRSNPSKKKGGSSCKTMNDFYRIDKDCVDEAFRELRDEIGDSRQETMDWMTTMVDPFDVDQFPVDKKTAKKWIEKAFDFAFEFNEDFATAPGEKDATEEFLRKSRDWVARMYEEGAKEEEEEVDDYDDDNFYEEEEEEVETETTKNRNDDGSASSYTEGKSESQQSRSTPIPEKADEIVSETPKSEDRSTEDMFRVSIDLPGVVRSDIDITLDSDFLLVRAKRDGESDGLPTRMYTKKLAVSENEVDMEQLKANLKNGVLVISAPKKKTIETKRKIPVS